MKWVFTRKIYLPKIALIRGKTFNNKEKNIDNVEKGTIIKKFNIQMVLWNPPIKP